MKTLTALLFSITIFSAGAAELIVDYSRKDKSAYADFQSALVNAKSGDTVKILKVDFPIHDAIVIKSRNNITVDGMLNTFAGTEKATAKNWNKIAPGLWKRDIRCNPGISMRYFMIINGKLNRMGRFFKAKCSTRYKKVDELKENEWTIIENPNTAVKKTRLYSIYLKLDKSVNDISLADIAEPRIIQTNGVEISGRCKNVTFKNIICRNFWNDGFNIHKTCTNTVFETICALDCGDDGISAHEKSSIVVKNFVSIGNSTGICHIDQVTASHQDCYISGALGRDIYFQSKPKNLLNNSLKNIFIKSSSAGGVFLGAAPQDKLAVYNLNIVLERTVSAFHFVPDKKANVSAANITISNTEPEKMVLFRKSLFKKFNGEIEKNLSAR